MADRERDRDSRKNPHEDHDTGRYQKGDRDGFGDSGADNTVSFDRPVPPDKPEKED
jgi:hypothetical protein